MQIKLVNPNIWIANQPVDFRRSIDGLCEIITSQLDRKVREGIYVFYNRARNCVKILGWHYNGFILIYKRLEHGRFTSIQNANDDTAQLTEQQLRWLLSGLDWVQMSQLNERELEDYF